VVSLFTAVERRGRKAARISTGVAAVLGAVGVVAISPGMAAAQGSVSGQISILERPGSRSNDLADAVVWLELRGGGGTAARSNAQIVMESREFVPRVRVVGVGSAVGFPNQDPFRHNVFSKAGPAEFDLGLNIHSRMVAFIVAVPTPYVAQPNPDGRFTISAVPAGAYTLHAWHDRGGEQASEVTVAADGRSDLSVQLDARGYRSMPHKNKFGQEYTNSGRDRY
jgi:polysaccharide lyase family 4-like protein